MGLVLIDTGFLTVKVRYSLLKDGVFFYYRRIPEKLRGQYGGKLHRRVSLGTNQPHIAAKKIAALASADDALWASLRSPEGQALGLTTREARDGANALLSKLELSPGQGSGPDFCYVVDVLDDYFIGRYGADYERSRHDESFSANFPPDSFYNPVEREAVNIVMGDPQERRVLLTDALEVYLQNHKNGEQSKFSRDAHRAIGCVVSSVGDLPLNLYRREHANAVRNHLLSPYPTSKRPQKPSLLLLDPGEWGVTQISHYV